MFIWPFWSDSFGLKTRLVTYQAVLEAIIAELQGAENDVEAMIGASRRVPRVVEAPQEALQLQRQDAMRDAEKMATQAPFFGSWLQ